MQTVLCHEWAGRDAGPLPIWVLYRKNTIGLPHWNAAECSAYFDAHGGSILFPLGLFE